MRVPSPGATFNSYVVTLLIQFALFFSSMIQACDFVHFHFLLFYFGLDPVQNLTWKFSFPRKPPPSPQTPSSSSSPSVSSMASFTVKLFNILISTVEVLLFLKLSAFSLKNHGWMQYKAFKVNSGRSVQTIMCESLGTSDCGGKGQPGGNFGLEWWVFDLLTLY